MNKIFFLLLGPLLLVAKVHYAKVETYSSAVLKSAVSGQVVDVLLDAEGTTLSGERIVLLDDTLDKAHLKDTRKGIELLESMILLNRQIAKELKGTSARQERYMKRISALSTVSKTKKESAYNAYASAKTQYLSTKEKIISLKKQIVDMQYKVTQLEETISKKSIVIRGKYLYKLMVKEGDFVAPGTPLAKIKDLSRAKLVLFLDKEELQGVESKTIYLDDNKSSYKVDKIWRMADEKFISSYRAEIYIDAPKDRFSELIKVEIR